MAKIDTTTILLIAMASAPGAACAEGVDPSDAGGVAELDTLDEMLIDDLDILFEDFDVVVTASREEQRASMTSVPVSVIDRDDIRYSGAGEIEELFFLVPGLDTVRIGRNQWGVGVRGLHALNSDRTLLLVNGRQRSNPTDGGFDLQREPIMLHEIERIEVVRGPAGGSWGANAFNGVINIIEMSPFDSTGVYLSQRVNHYGDSTSRFRIGDGDESFAWRVSGEWEEHESTGARVIDLESRATLARDAGDFARKRALSFDAAWRGSGSELEFGLDYAHTERGVFDAGPPSVSNDERFDNSSSYLTLTFNPGGDTTGHVQWYGAYSDVIEPANYRYTSWDNNLDAQISFSPADDHRVTVGGTVRWLNITLFDRDPTFLIGGGTFNEQWIGAFVSDRWEIADRWTLETQFRMDDYSGTQLDWAGRAALLRQLDADGRHVLRLAAARSFRTPQVGTRELSNQNVPIDPGPPPLFLVNLLKSKDIENESIASLELGYTGRATDEITVRLNGYVQRYQDLVGLDVLPEPDPQVGRTFLRFDSIYSADAYGVEAELEYSIEHATMYAWYAYNEFELEQLPANTIRAFLPAEHKIGLGARYRVGDRLTLNADYRYTDVTEGPAAPPTTISPAHRLDLTATFALPDGHGEIQLGVNDLFDQTDSWVDELQPGTTGVPSKGTTFFVEARISF